jgi:hypothetical protein
MTDMAMAMGRSPFDTEAVEKIKRLGMSPRQQRLNAYLARYRCAQYDTCAVSWDGGRHVEGIDREAIVTQGFVPPGFYDASMGTNVVPFRFRRPSTPLHLGKTIVDRFTSLLFSERMHPRIVVEGDPDTEDYVAAIVDAARFWQFMVLARTLGGAMGTTVGGFSFLDGKVAFEAHDPRWITPTWRDRRAFQLAAIEERYWVPVEVYDPDERATIEVLYWYRRVIDESVDVVFKPALVGDGEEPQWVIDRAVRHDLGFCPVVWAQNVPVLDDVDGDPDAHGAFDMLDQIDALLSMASFGTTNNCDPTMILASDLDLGEVTSKGSKKAIGLEKGGDAKYLEIAGTGPKAARELAMELRQYALEVTQCVLERPGEQGATPKTATEVLRAYSSMHARADVLREQYGERFIKPLLSMVVRAARAKTGSLRDANGAPARDAQGRRMVGVLDLPQRIEQDGDDIRRVDRVLGTGGDLRLQWPSYVTPTLEEESLAVRSAGEARALGLVDNEHAVKKVAAFYGVEDVSAMLQAMQEQRAEQAGTATDAQQTQMVHALGMRGGARAALGGVASPYTQTEIEGGLVTIDEARAARGLGPLPDGDGGLTLPAYRAKHAATIAKATVAENAATAATLLDGDSEDEEPEPADALRGSPAASGDNADPYDDTDDDAPDVAYELPKPLTDWLDKALGSKETTRLLDPTRPDEPGD